MASVLAECVVGKVTEMVSQQATDQANIKEDFEVLKDQIEQINLFLNEVHEKSDDQKESVEKWLQRVRDIAWDTEDMLEEFAVESVYATNVKSCTFTCNQWSFRHQMGRRIREVKTRISSVVQERYQLNVVRAEVLDNEEAEPSNRSHGQQFRISSLPARDSIPVGIQSKIERILELLENPRNPIIAVVGMGGIGKTYLLKNVYSSVKERYEISAWLSVSEFYSVSKLQRDLAFRLKIDLSNQIKEGGVNESQAAELISGFLLEKKYLIVLDDVWRAAKEKNLIARIGIPTGGNSESKLLVSTRSREVAENLKAEIYELEVLTEEESWSLFCLHAFPKCEGNKAPQCLEEVALNIVKACGNLPLAIKTVAASLASTTLLSDWHSKLSKLKYVGASNETVMNVLKLSYDSLPAHLKPCFAYLSFFPEDEEIECEYLVYLWMGEGFIPTGEKPWDCLYQLANLCLIEIRENEFLDKYCKLHDSFLELANSISEKNCCAFGVKGVDVGDRCCRLFLAKKDIDDQAISERLPVSPKLVRTLSLSRNSKIGGNIPEMLFSSMRVLRVLDLSYTYISTLPACVGKMKLLKVLSLRRTEIKKVPECVRCLKSLTFLDVSECDELDRRQAPNWISELKFLQHLEGPFKRMPKEIAKLKSLRTLRGSVFDFLSLSVEDDRVLSLDNVGEMSEIEEIAIKVEHESQLLMIEGGILAPLEKLRRLKVENKVKGMRSNLPQLPETMSALEDLSLYGFAVPSWACSENFRRLYLYGCDCNDYPGFEAMPKLVSLALSKNKSCRKLPESFGKSGGFPQLRFLFIGYFDELEEFPKIEDEAMVCLEKLELSNCRKVNKVEGLERLNRLKEFDYCSSGTDELRATLKDGGEYCTTIKARNPRLTIRGSK